MAQKKIHNIDFTTKELFKYVQDAPARWNEAECVRELYARNFYQGIFTLPKIDSGYSSRDALLNTIDATDDHFLAPRIVFRAAMDQCPEIIEDYETFQDLVELCRHTVKVTNQQNALVKTYMDGARPVIKKHTIHKYDGWGWFKNGVGFLRTPEFPMKHLVPTWLTDFERKWIK